MDESFGWVEVWFWTGEIDHATGEIFLPFALVSGSEGNFYEVDLTYRIMEDSMKKRASTSVEFLLVIAILSILAALLMPSLSRAKMAAHKAICVNNQK